jgi:hypothetical protein
MISRDEETLRESFWDLRDSEGAVVQGILYRRFPEVYSILSRSLEAADPMDVVYPGNPDEYSDVVREVIVLLALGAAAMVVASSLVPARADAAAGRGVAHHHVVEARLRNEGEASQQRVGGGDVKVDAAHEQRRIGFLQLRSGERPVPRIPALAMAFHHPGFDVVARRERCQRTLVDHAGETGQRVWHEERSLLPITAQKRARRKPAQQFHRADYM